MRRTINVEHRECSLHVAIVITIAGARGFGKPGDLDPTGSPVAHTGAAHPRGERRGSGSPGLRHTAQRVSALLRCPGPISQSSFLSRPNITQPSRCALPSVHLGLFLGHLLCQELMAGELVKGSPVPMAPPAPFPPTPRLSAPASRGSDSRPRSSLRSGSCGHSARRHVSSQLVTEEQLGLMLCQASCFPTRLLFLCAPPSTLPTHPYSLPIEMGVQRL